MKKKSISYLRIGAAWLLSAATVMSALPSVAFAAEVEDAEAVESAVEEEAADEDIIEEAVSVEALAEETVAEDELLEEDTLSDDEVSEDTVETGAIVSGPLHDYFLTAYDMKNQSSDFYNEEGHSFNDTFSLDGVTGHKVQKLVFGKKPSEINGEAVWKIAGTEEVEGVDSLVLVRDIDNYKYQVFYSEPSPGEYKVSRIRDIMNSATATGFDANIIATTSDKLRENIIRHEISYEVYNSTSGTYEDHVAYDNYEYIPDGKAGDSYITVGYGNKLKVDRSNWGVQSGEAIWLRSDAGSIVNARTADGSGQVKDAAKTGLGYVVPVMNIKTDNIIFASRAGVLESECANKSFDTYMEAHEGAMYPRFDGTDKIRSTIELDTVNNKLLLHKSTDDFGDVYVGIQCSIQVDDTTANMFSAEKLTEDMTISMEDMFSGADLSNISNIQVWLEYWDSQDKIAYAIVPQKTINTCRIGAKEYPNLKAAVNSVSGSEKTTITMVTDETLNEKLFASGNNRNIVIDLKGRTITNGYKGSAYPIEVFDTDKIEIRGNGALKKCGIKVNGGELILDGPTIDNSGMNNVSVEKGSAVIKSGVYGSLYSAVENKGITIEGGYFSGNFKTSLNKYVNYYDIKGGYFIDIDSAKMDIVKKSYVAEGYELFTTLEIDRPDTQEAYYKGYRYVVDVATEPEKVEEDKSLAGASVKSSYKGVNYYIFSDGTMYLKGNATDDLILEGREDYENFYPWQDPEKCNGIEIKKIFCDFNPDANIIDGLFAYMDSLEVVSFGDSFKNNNQAGSFKAMFEGCSNLTTVDLSGISTENIDDITNMFAFCRSLKSIDVSSFDINTASEMSGVFQGCYSLEAIALFNWNTKYSLEKTINMSDMFKDCSSLTVVSIGNWDVSKVSDMSGMFANCKNLVGIDIADWDVSSVTDMSDMFANDENLRTLDISKWNVSMVKDMSKMFYRCKNLYSVSVDNWVVNECTDFTGMFENCTSMDNLSLANWEITGTTDKLLNGCVALRSIICPKSTVADIALPCEMCEAENLANKYTVINSSNVTKRLVNAETIDADYAGELSGIKWAIKDGKLTLKGKANDRLITADNITSLKNNIYQGAYYPWSWFADEITSVECDFDADGYNLTALLKGLSSLESVTFGSNFKTTGVKSFAFMFFDCKKLKEIDLSSFDVSSGDDFEGMLAYCESLERVKTTGWNLSAEDINMRGMFLGCEALSETSVENWNVSNVSNMMGMFIATTSLRELDLSKWTPVNVNNMEAMFQESGVTQIKFGDWNLSKLTDVGYIFQRCNNLLELDLSGWELKNDVTPMLYGCDSLNILKTPKSSVYDIELPCIMYDLSDGAKAYSRVSGEKSLTLSRSTCAHAKTHESVVFKPGCEKTGLNYIICDACKEKVGTKETEPIGHSPLPEVEENRIEPTTEKEGSVDKVVYCDNCGNELSRNTEILDKIGSKEGDLEAFALANETQINQVKEIIDDKKGTSASPEYVDIKQSVNDTAVVRTGYVKGKAKTFTITGLDILREDVVNVTAGGKIFIDETYAIVNVTSAGTTYTDAKDIKKYAKASVKKAKNGSAYTVLTTKAGKKYPDSYTIMLNGSKGDLKVVVNNIWISKTDGKVTMSSSQGPKSIGLRTLNENKSSNIGAVVWTCNKVVVPAGEKNAIAIAGKTGDFAKVYVDTKTGDVVVTPISAAAGKLKLAATSNGKSYKAAVTIEK